MPNTGFAFTAKIGGLVNVLRTNVEIKAHGGGKDFSSSKTLDATWDTGAMGSVVARKIADDLGLPVIGYSKISTANGPCEVPFYYIDVKLPNQIVVQKLRVSGGRLPEKCDMLIGMDIISLGDFAVSNYQGKTTFTFRCPSLMEFDFVQNTYLQPYRKNGQVQEPNDLCSCGSGKKYKNCCGNFRTN
jgi:predicted aspartyl protease